MSIALNLYEQLNRASDEPERFQVIADAFDAMEQRYIARENVATKGDLRETELRLQKEIELLRATTETELARIRGEMQSVELNLRREIETVKGELSKEIEQVRLETRTVEARLLGAMHRQTIWIISAVGAVVGLVRVLDYLFT